MRFEGDRLTTALLLVGPAALLAGAPVVETVAALLARPLKAE